MSELSIRRKRRRRGGFREWTNSGLPVVGSKEPPDGERIDFLFWCDGRFSGSAAACAKYLKWEEALPAAIEADGLSGFQISASGAAKAATAS